jgi:hypothetical protein
MEIGDQQRILFLPIQGAGSERPKRVFSNSQM